MFETQDCDGDIIDSIAPMNMTASSGALVCGKRGGSNFLDTVRVDPYTWKCPDSMVPCSEFTPATDTICIEESRKEEDCPILDLAFIRNDEALRMVSEGFLIADFGFADYD